MMTRSRKGDSSRSTTEDDATGATNSTNTTDTLVSTETSAPTEETSMEEADRTVVGKARSKKSSKAASKKRELEARLELEKLQLEEIKMKAKMAATKLELAQAAEDTDISDEDEDPEAEDVTARATADWVKTTKRLDRDEGERAHAREAPRASLAPGGAPSASSRANQLAEVILEACKSASNSKTMPALQRAPKYVSELHPFEGDARDWIAFKATYTDTKELFGAIENMGRLRRAVRGKAKEAVKSMLYTQTDPEIVIAALERRFGRSTYLIRGEIENIEKLPPMSEDAKEIVRYAGAIANTVSVIQQIKKNSYLHSSDISNRVIEKMCTLVKFKWYEYRASKEDQDEPILLSLMQFFNQLVDRFELHEPSKPFIKREGFKSKLRNPGTRGVHTTQISCNDEEEDSSEYEDESEDDVQENRRGAVVVCSCEQKKTTREVEKLACPLCKEEHFLMQCKKFEEASIQDKWDVARKSGTCFRCLKRRHRGYNCRAKPCPKCHKGHHPLLHYEDDNKQKPKEHAQVVTSTVNAIGNIDKVYLKIIPVELLGPEGKLEAHALLDEGSTVTLIEERIAKKIGARGPEETLRIEGVGGHRLDQPSQRIEIKIKGLFARTYEQLDGYTVKDLHLMPQEIRKEDLAGCNYLEEIKDQLQYPRARPTILVGQDNWRLIVSQEIKAGGKNEPVASRTQLGWVLHGTRLSSCNTVRVVNHLVNQPPQKDDHLEKMIKEHFSIEALGVEPRKPRNDIDQRALEILKGTTRKTEEGRFSTGLLWKTDDEVLPESRTAAMRRLKSLEKKFNRDEQLKQNYEEHINNLLNNEYAEEAPEKPTSVKTWYLPHFAVIHPQKKKMRVVFDAAAKSYGKSLNDALLAGPDLLQSLFGVLVRFRQGPVAVVADIKEMFLRIKINEEDRDSLRFLWKDQEFRMKSLIFGAACSPCTAIYVKDKNAERFAETYPEAVKAVKKSHYMDDYLASFPDTTTAQEISTQVDEIHKSGGFHLRGWASNDPRAIEAFTQKEDSVKTVRLGEPQQEQVEKTLGLNWNVKKDSLHFTLNLRNTPTEAIDGKRAPTKRETTSAVMSVFDPLGLAAPITIQGKVMIQNLWRCGLEWDETLPPQRQEEWKKWLQDLKLLQGLHIPRCLSGGTNEGELHVFCDASERAYACVAYWRTRQPNGLLEVKLIASKARVSPLKPTSIPRLELQACLLGSRLATSIANELEFTISSRYFWTDSRTALAWIKSDPRRYKSFVAHRLAEIEDSTRQREWRWVPTKHNVADDATRSTPANFDINHRWFRGPEFLYEDPEYWPADTSNKPIEDIGEERPNVTFATSRPPITMPDTNRFSRWTRLLRATARFLQAVDVFKLSLKKVHSTRRITRQREDPAWKKARKKTTQRILPTPKTSMENSYIPLTIHYIEKAERLLILKIQEDSFQGELQAIKNKQEVKRSSRLGNLKLEIEDGLLRLSTRIRAATYVPESYKSPIILDGKHRMTRMLIEHLHTAYGHANHQTVLNEIRQKYWVTSLRDLVRSVARKCGWCKLRKSLPPAVPQGDLPPERLRKGSAPFTCAAVDYFGPMHVTVGRRTEKRWGALFTCLTTRAVHLELACSLSADSMIMTLRRMIARRGTPRVLYSDNGTNFIAANKEISAEIGKIEEKTASMGIVWKFIPPGAPNMGGSWERLVRSVKVALAATLKERQPREEVLHTVLLEAEHMINSRPLFTVDLQPNQEEEALTPNHFLIGRSSGASIFGTFDDTADYGTPDWKKSQRLADHFWSRWVREYLPTLAPRYNTGPHYTDPAIGDIVLIVDHTLPRCSWPRGEIVATYPGPDGRTRIVDVRTTVGVLKRPASRLVIIVPASSLLHKKVRNTEGENVSDEVPVQDTVPEN